MGEIEDRLNRNMYMLFKQKKTYNFCCSEKRGSFKIRVGRAEELLL